MYQDETSISKDQANNIKTNRQLNIYLENQFLSNGYVRKQIKIALQGIVLNFIELKRLELLL
jgi:hypothetical protein